MCEFDTVKIIGKAARLLEDHLIRMLKIVWEEEPQIVMFSIKRIVCMRDRTLDFLHQMDHCSLRQSVRSSVRYLDVLTGYLRCSVNINFMFLHWDILERKIVLLPVRLQCKVMHWFWVNVHEFHQVAQIHIISGPNLPLLDECKGDTTPQTTASTTTTSSSPSFGNF